MPLSHSQGAAASELWRTALEAGLDATDQLHLVVTKWAMKLSDDEAAELSRMGRMGLDWLGIVAVSAALVDGRGPD